MTNKHRGEEIPIEIAAMQPLEPRDPEYRTWIFTIPNIICMFRLVGSAALLGVAIAGFPYWFVGLFTVLTLSDWIDGRLARWLHQRSDFGARLDSFADAALYGALLFGCAILARDTLMREWMWIALAVGSYFLTTSAGLLKYGRVPSYHTWAAKKSQALVLIAGITLVLGISVWPLRVAAVAVFFTNLEATLLTVVLPTWQADVSSLWFVLERARARKEEN
jgi:CDP-diacylglycerol--glycerol-3-phosphate 3-phosphatidyltransferase